MKPTAKLSIALAIFLALGLGSRATAQSDGDLALIAGQGSVAPNVMLFFDTSGSMNHVAWEAGFDMFVYWDVLAGGGAAPSAQCSIGAVPTQSGSSGNCVGSRDPGDSCPDSESNHRAATVITCPDSILPQGCAGWPLGFCLVTGNNVELTLPDYSQQFSEQTRWSRNYLHWYITTTSQSGAPFFPITYQTRTQVGQAAFKTVIDQVNPDLVAGGYEENVLFGLAQLHGSDGGFVIEPIAPGNKLQLMNSIDALDATGSTPISEALVDMGRYFVGGYQNLGAYPQYNRDTLTGAVTASAPPSPIDPTLPCQQNFVVLMTDGQPTNDLNDHHGTAFAATIGDYDQDGSEATAGVDELDDVAGYLAVEDLVADTTMLGKQSVVTYTIGFSIDLPLLQDAAINGNGIYYQSTSAPQLAVQLKQALNSIIARASTFTAASVPSSRTQFGDGFYTGYFEPIDDQAFWPGHLEAYRIDTNFDILGKNDVQALDPATGQFIDPRRPIWDVGHKLAGTNGESPHPPRNLFTALAGARADFTAANVSALDLGVGAADMTLYPNDPAVPFATTEALADAVVDYVRGHDSFDQDRDLDPAETRREVLGDIFHSSPIVVGTPPPFLMSESGFGPPTDPASHFGKYAFRDRKLYVGANDGMLHGVNAGVLVSGPNGIVIDHTEAIKGSTGGQEAFGYVPSFLLQKLKQLPIQTTNSRSFYVDGDPAAADVWLAAGPNDTSKEANEWATTLISGMRRGGDGYVALDISEPGATSGPHGPYPKLLWEFADPTEPLAETWSKPVLTRIKVEGGPGGDFCNSGTIPPADCKEHWVAIFAGGYTEEGDAVLPGFATPADAGWTVDGKAIFVVSLESGLILAKMEYGGAATGNMIYALPSDPAVVDIDFDGFADLVYVGDTGGQMWKWDISEVGQKDVQGRVTNWPGGLFFQAPVASNSHHKSLFFPPTVSYVSGKLMLSFGTGERTDLTHYHDPAVDDENRFYVISDPGLKGSSSIPSTPYSESDLTQLNGSLQDPDPQDMGFFLVADPGEKFVTNHLAFAGFLITASFVPLQGVSSSCASGGDAYLYIFELEGGGGFFGDPANDPPDSTRRLALGSGVPTDPNITTSNNGTNTGTKIVLQTSDGSVASVDGPDEGVEPVSMVYWQQQL